MTYQISNYTKERAKELNIIVRPSTNINKKIDVFDKNFVKIASIGSIKYKDYPQYLQENKELADERRRLYHIRHSKNTGINGYLAKYLLW